MLLSTPITFEQVLPIDVAKVCHRIHLCHEDSGREMPDPSLRSWKRCPAWHRLSHLKAHLRKKLENETRRSSESEGVFGNMEGHSCNPSESLAAAAIRRGEWRDLENKSLNLSMFEATDYAFPPQDNRPYHARNSIRIDHNPTVDDYWPQFEAAFKKLKELGGGTVFVGPGTFTHSKQIEIPSYCCLQGAGMERTVIKVADYSPPFPRSGAIRTHHSERVSIFDLTQDGNRDRQHLRNDKESYGRYGIYTHLSNFVWMRGVKVRNNYKYAFDPHGSNDHWSYYLVIEDCISEYNGLDGFTIDQYFYVSVLRNTGRFNERHGVNVISGSRFVLVKGCLFHDNGAQSGKGFGMVAQNNATDGKFDTNSCLFLENQVKDCRRGAVCLRDVWNIRVERNMFEHRKCLDDFVVYELNETKRVRIKGNTLLGQARREFKVINDAEFEN